MFVSTVGSVDSVLFFYSVLVVVVFTSYRNKLDNLDISLFLILALRDVTVIKLVADKFSHIYKVRLIISFSLWN